MHERGKPGRGRSGAIAALPEGVAKAVAELRERRGIQSGDADFGASHRRVVEVALDDCRDDSWPIRGVQRDE